MINLLPYEDRKEVARETLRRFLVIAFALSSLVILVGIFLMVPIYFLLRSEKVGLLRVEELSRRGEDAGRVAIVDEEIKKLNKRISVLESASAGEVTSDVFRKIIDVMPDGISLDGFSYSRSDISAPGRIGLGGNARTREDLVSFERILRESGFAQNVVSPLANILKKSDIDFSISFDIEK